MRLLLSQTKMLFKHALVVHKARISYIDAGYFSIGKAEDWGNAVASSMDANAAYRKISKYIQEILALWTTRRETIPFPASNFPLLSPASWQTVRFLRKLLDTFRWPRRWTGFPYYSRP